MMSATIQPGVQTEPARKYPASRGPQRPPLPAWVPVPAAAGPARHWRDGTGIALGADGSPAAVARDMAAATLKLWGLDPAAEMAKLLVSEVVANAAAASQGLRWPIRVWIRPRVDMRAVLVTVWDPGYGTPVLGGNVLAPDLDGLARPDLDGLEWLESLEVDEIERGLGAGVAVVDREADAWGSEPWTAPPGVPGKTSWFVLMVPAETDPPAG